MKLLSIVIPSYNRYARLTATVKEMLTAKSNDFEIVVVDNVSPNIPEEFLSIKDERLRLVKRKEAIYGPINQSRCHEFSEGLFSFIVLDKDRFPGEYIDEFLEALNKYKDKIVGGRCQLNQKQNKETKIVSNKPLLSFGYLDHPTGCFYKTDILKDFIKNGPVEMINMTYVFDIYLMYCASKGSMMYYDKKSVYTSTPEDISKEKTLSFFAKDDSLHFSPKNKINDFVKFKELIDSFNLERNYYDEVLQAIYNDAILRLTFWYKMILESESLCIHYNVKQRIVRKDEMLNNIKLLNTKLYEINNNEEQNKKLIHNGEIYFKKLELKDKAKDIKRLSKKILGKENYNKIKRLIKGDE